MLSAADVSKTAILVGRFAAPLAQLDRPERARFGTLRLPAAGLALPVARDRGLERAGHGLRPRRSMTPGSYRSVSAASIFPWRQAS